MFSNASFAVGLSTVTGKAICSSHYCVSAALESTGESTSDPPQACNKNVRVFLPHVKSVLENWQNASSCSKVRSEVLLNLLELYMFFARAQTFLGQTMAIFQLCESWYRLLVKEYGSNTVSSSVSEALYEIGAVSLRNGSANNAFGWYTLSPEITRC